MKYRVSCHCGQVAGEAEGTIGSVLACNCSICQRKGSLLWFVPKASFTLLTDDAKAATYTFNEHVIRHRFCPTCGMHPYGEGKDAKGNAMVAVNARCIEGIDIEALQVQHYDGRSK